MDNLNFIDMQEEMEDQKLEKTVIIWYANSQGQEQAVNPQSQICYPIIP